MKKILILLLIAAVVAAYYWLGGDITQLGHWFREQIDEQPVVAGLLYFFIYVIVTAFSLPIAALMTLLGGALFGLGWGLLIISFASTIGATLAFLLARTLLRDWVQERFSRELKTINDGVAKQGAYYLFTLRLIPAVPFFVINLAFALTPMKTWTFYWVSQLGMLAGTAVYVNAGAELGAIESLSASGILTPGLVGAFILLALLPYVLRSVVSRYEAYKIYRPFTKPKQFDTNLVVIGAGAAGLVSAYIAAAVKAKVTLIEREQMGGDCLNTGCVPSKALISAAKLSKGLQQASDLGAPKPIAGLDFGQVMGKVHRAIDAIEPHDSVERYTDLGVDCVQGDARIVSPWEVEVNGKTIATRNIILAAGAAPRVPDIDGIRDVDYVTSEDLWQIKQQPKRLLVMGGGPIGCELAQAFARLGSDVTLIGRARQLLPREEPAAGQLINEQLTADGVTVITGATIERFSQSDSDGTAHWQLADGSTGETGFDKLLVAVGREARSQQFCDFKLPLTDAGTLQVNEYLQTPYPNIYACGDIVGPYQFTHVAAHQAWYAAVNSLFGRFKKFKVDYRVIPRVTFTSPEVASVGITEQQAQDQEIKYSVTQYDLSDLDRAITDGCAQGFVKVITPEGSDKILGVTVVAEHAGEMLPEWVLAMKHGLGLNKILGTIHAYPTFNEANKFLAGEWKKAHKPEGLLRWVERYHQWQRG
ncbi:MAG: bifunctional TVP38/TMEM64 family protein/FAD-dependent oxidoreductase [Candidatus Pelagadaptatus aseana]|uniref:FAD-dependent oxidoreductase n=1 Tax=Candidatus Pelagadaptatus aseana TaxID=3120508 RepID=UPI0039B292FC